MKQKKPIISAVLLGLIILGCIGCRFIMTKDPTYMDLANYSHAPNGEFLFGTDTMGLDIFSMIWYGGAISTAIAIVFGAVSGYAPRWLDEILMRLTEIFLSVPELLIIILLQAVIGKATIWSLAFVIGITSWTGIAKIVRTEVIQLKNSEYVLAARSMGGSFFYILIRHLTPNFISSIMFMVVMNVRGAIVAESTLSFMGLGLPLEVVSWGSMLSLADRALLNGAWWIILIPGAFLVTTLMCVTNLGNYLRIRNNQGVRNL